MKNDTLIKESLIYKNRDNHENSDLTEVKSGKELRGAEWVNIKSKGIPDAKMPIHLDLDGNVLFAPFTHATINGSTGTGKSEVIVKNMLEIFALANDESKPSFIASDLKGDISAQLSDYLESHGYNVVVMDMKKPYQSKRYNFLSRIYDDYHEANRIEKMLKTGEINTTFGGKRYSSKAQAMAAANAYMLHLNDKVEKAIAELANIVIVCTDEKDLNWFQGARTMFSAIVFTLLYDSLDEKKYGMTREKFTMANVCRAAFTTDDDCDTIIDWLKRADSNLTVQNAITGNYKLNAKVTRDGYVSTLNTALGAYVGNAVTALTSTSDDINLRDVAKREKPYAIFLITDDQQKVTNSIAMMFINDLVSELTDYADRVGARALKRDFVFLLDEFANMPPLPEMSNKITTLRSRRIWLMMAIQSIQQLRKVYGDDTSNIIIDNCDTTVFLGSNNLETKQIFANSMGKKTGIVTSYNKGNNGEASENINTADVPVVRISDLDSLTLGEFYIRSRGLGNIKSYMVPFFERKDLDINLEANEPTFRMFNPSDNMYKIGDALEADSPSFERTSPKFKFNF